jgi:hypothetical protein
VFWTYCLFFVVFVVFCWDCSGKHKHANECWDQTYRNCLWLSLLWFGWNPFSAKSRRYHAERSARFGKNMRSLFGHCDMSLSDFVLAFMNARHRARHSDVVEMNRDCSLTECLLERGMTTMSSVDSVDSVDSVGTGSVGGVGGVGGFSTGESSDSLTLKSLLASNVYRNTRIRGDPVEPAVLEDVAYYYKYALAAYGWMLYFLGRGLVPGLWAVAYGGKGAYFPMFRGRSNVEIACREIGTGPSNILFLREQGAVENVLCYVIAIDHEKKCIVLSVRGAMTIDDNVKDILLDPGELDGWMEAASQGSWEVRPPEVRQVTELPGSPGSSTTFKYVAQGEYLEASRATLCDILDCGILKDALHTNEGYGLTFAGHSLGAVGSFFLALYFHKWVPNVRCWCFSPPAGLVDVAIAESCESWCTSVANGKEIVARFSASSLDRARDQIVCSFASVSVPKWRLMYKLLWKYWALYKDDDDISKPLDPDCLPDEVRGFLEEYVRSRNEDHHRRYLVEAANRMSLPGRVIYFEPKPKEEGDGLEKKESSMPFKLEMDMVMPNERDYTAKYVRNRAICNQGVILSGRLLADHMPDYAEEVITKMRGGV